MSRRVATITLNPAYDLVGFTPEIERGEVNLVRTTGLHAAGKGINVAKVLKDLGIDVTVGGFLGKDNQDGFQQLFSELGIANRFQVVQGRTRINVKLTEKDGEVTDFNFSGFEVTPGDWERFVNDSLSWLGQFDMVCVSGSLPSGVSPEAFTDWMTRLRSQCPCIIFDSSREALVAGLKAAPWLVKPNRRELEIWAGRKLPEMKDVIDAAHALREQGIAHVVISLGEEGALWVNASGEWIAKPPSVEVVSTVGAGDSMVGGLIYGLLMRESSEEAAATLKELDNINQQAIASIDVIYEQTNITNISALKIKEATTLISSIAEETNLLSLNASIEAARAGEAGRGFAVVASQIQKLADQSNESANQIDQIIHALIEDSEKAVKTMDEVKTIMNLQSENVHKTGQVFEQVRDGISSSISGVGEIATKTTQLDKARGDVVDVVQNLTAIAQQNAASTEETSASVMEVSNVMQEIMENANRLKEIASILEENMNSFTL